MGDPLLVSGGEEVLFLKYSPITGKYATVGDSQGRFAIDPSGTVRALGAADFRYTAAYSGETVDGLAAAIRAVE